MSVQLLQYNYIIINYDNITNSIEGDYISKNYAIKFLQKYKSYIFKFKSNLDILYLNYPLNDYYRNSSINNLENPTEENIASYSYLEIRLTPIIPSIRIGTNIDF